MRRRLRRLRGDRHVKVAMALWRPEIGAGMVLANVCGVMVLSRERVGSRGLGSFARWTCLGLLAVGCAGLAGVDGDHYEVGPDAGLGGGAGAGTAGTGATGATGGSAGSAKDAQADSDSAPPRVDCAKAGGQCAAAPPAGWSGPVLVDATGAKACPEQAALEVLSGMLNQNLDAGTAKCGCACAPNPMNCGSANVYLHYPADCAAGAYKGSVAAGACLTIDFNGSEDLRASNKNQQIQPGACTAQQIGGVPTPSFQDSARACAVNTTEGSCDPNQVCVPPLQAGFQLCLYQAGNHSCPAGYEEQETYFGSVSDTRSCSACTCGTPTGTCSGTFTMYSDGACQNALATSTIACGDSVQVAQSISYNPTADNVNCPASSSTLSGSATEQEPITVCCQ